MKKETLAEILNFSFLDFSSKLSSIAGMLATMSKNRTAF
jgi:chemotaxis protein CheY-P-specific phosphatase CheC